MLKIAFSLSLATTVSLWSQPPEPWQRVSNTTLRMPASIADETAALLPPTLADTGAFSDLVNLTPNAGIVPYDLNVPLWSDGAHKARWFCLPDTNLTVGFEREIPWSFPAGSVWIKHFELPLSDGDPSSARRIETRFLVRNTAGVYGVTYRWDDSQTNATLVATEGLNEDIDMEEQGETHTQVWHYPSRKECLSCHTPVAGWSLGFNTWQLNRELDHGGVTNNQIAALEQAGYFSSKSRAFIRCALWQPQPTPPGASNIVFAPTSPLIALNAISRGAIAARIGMHASQLQLPLRGLSTVHWCSLSLLIQMAASLSRVHSITR